MERKELKNNPLIFLLSFSLILFGWYFVSFSVKPDGLTFISPAPFSIWMLIRSSCNHNIPEAGTYLPAVFPKCGMKYLPLASFAVTSLKKNYSNPKVANSQPWPLSVLHLGKWWPSDHVLWGSSTVQNSGWTSPQLQAQEGEDLAALLLLPWLCGAWKDLLVLCAPHRSASSACVHWCSHKNSLRGIICSVEGEFRYRRLWFFGSLLVVPLMERSGLFASS